MNIHDAWDTENKLVAQLRGEANKNMKTSPAIPDERLRKAVQEWLAAGNAPDEKGKIPPTDLANLVAGLLQAAAEENKLRVNVAASLGSALSGVGDSLEKIVNQRFEGATREIADRHLQMVRQERTKRITTAVLAALEGNNEKEPATFTGILAKTAKAVTDSFAQLPAFQKSDATTAAQMGQVAQAVSQAVQQVALNLQKIITVAIESERGGDETHPKYYG